MNLKKFGRYLGVNLLGPGPRLIKKEFTGPRSRRGWEKLHYMNIVTHLWQYVAEFSVESEIFQTKFVEKIKTHILCSVTFFSKILPFMR